MPVGPCRLQRVRVNRKSVESFLKELRATAVVLSSFSLLPPQPPVVICANLASLGPRCALSAPPDFDSPSSLIPSETLGALAQTGF